MRGAEVEGMLDELGKVIEEGIYATCFVEILHGTFPVGNT